MITARGANAARRDGGDAAGRPATRRPRRSRAVSVSGATAVAFSATFAFGAAGCAPAQKPTLDTKLLPGNQDTAAAARNAATPARGLAPGAPPHEYAPPTTITVTPGTWTTNQQAWQGMAAVLVATKPVAMMTPQNLGGSSTVTTSPTRPPLEVITMPMWLWVDSLGSMQTYIANDPLDGPTYVTDTVVVDEVQWYLDGSATPWMTCGSTTQPPAPSPTSVNPPSSGPGVPYESSMDPANSGDPQQLACIKPGFQAPYYHATTISGAPTTVDGVHQLVAQVNWHVEFSLTQPSGYPQLNGYGQALAMNTVPVQSSNTLTFRVGEIQALVTQP